MGIGPLQKPCSLDWLFRSKGWGQDPCKDPAPALYNSTTRLRLSAAGPAMRPPAKNIPMNNMTLEVYEPNPLAVLCRTTVYGMGCYTTPLTCTCLQHTPRLHSTAAAAAAAASPAACRAWVLLWQDFRRPQLQWLAVMQDLHIVAVAVLPQLKGNVAGEVGPAQEHSTGGSSSNSARSSK